MKLDRLLSIIMMLINNDILTAKDLAEKFDVSVRTIYRDIDILGAAGIPITSYQGINGGFGIIDGFKIEKGFFSNNDITSITASLKCITAIFADNKYNDTLNKIQNISPKKSNESLIMDLDNWDYEGYIKEKLNLINKAIDSNRLIIFKYTNSLGESILRKVDPITIIMKYNSWYFYGYCKMKNDFRVFKITRIRDLEITDEKSDLDKATVKEPEFNKTLGNNSFINLHLKFNANGAAKALDLFLGADVTFNNDGSLEVKVNCPEDGWIYSTILSFGKDVVVVEPEHIKKIIKEKAKEIYNLY